MDKNHKKKSFTSFTTRPEGFPRDISGIFIFLCIAFLSCFLSLDLEISHHFGFKKEKSASCIFSSALRSLFFVRIKRMRYKTKVL